MEAVWTRFSPSYIYLEKEIAAGNLGEIRFVEANFGIFCKSDRVLWVSYLFFINLSKYESYQEKIIDNIFAEKKKLVVAPYLILAYTCCNYLNTCLKMNQAKYLLLVT